MAGYCGSTISLGDLVAAPEHSLVVQSYKPREMVSGTVNADGYGVAMWLDDGKPEPAVYRTVAPIWADPNQAWMNERLRVRAAIAAVRSATPGIGYEVTNVQPFSFGRVAFLHNGFITQVRHGVERAVRDALGTTAYESIQGSSDSEHIFALVIDGLAQGLVPALRGALRKLSAICKEHDRGAVAALLLGDGEDLVACSWAQGQEPASLYAARFKGGWAFASEPLDRGDWQPVLPGRIAIARPGAGLRLESVG